MGLNRVLVSTLATSSAAATTAYQAPTSGNGTVVTSVYVSNLDNTNKSNHYISAQVVANGTTLQIVNAATVPYNQALIFDRPVVLNPGDELQFFGDTTSLMGVYVSLLEQ